MPCGTYGCERSCRSFAGTSAEQELSLLPMTLRLQPQRVRRRAFRSWFPPRNMMTPGGETQTPCRGPGLRLVLDLVQCQLKLEAFALHIEVVEAVFNAFVNPTLILQYAIKPLVARGEVSDSVP